MRAGITGHRQFRNTIISTWVKSEIRKLIKLYAVSHGYTCLAPGADELFAEVLNEEKIKYTAIIPCNNYEKTLDNDSLKTFQNSKANASEIIELNYNEPSEKAFDEAGKLLVNYADIIIAVWNGENAKGLGGTGDIVDYSIRKNKIVIHVNNITLAITKLK